ncbi:hypothetical protein PPERSA_11605 [Pseudocohnilembus persalinus]|uniref:Cation efflux protein transmembrane domain-containing protein n=1 Tax=Pseudocohnilembus persalinus TaxID=266149 RepID=A0A0V0Q9U5_PSEPJ|nr:hypothetical protein PPERSA_11605 [Pseudocohnilembus persalinus]|eukprot:KRW99004.1 hypothetical protein PPERSA_11605 [Pseudocohnilembus persalinus]
MEEEGIRQSFIISEQIKTQEQVYSFMVDTEFKPLRQSWDLLKACTPSIGSSIGLFIIYFFSMMAANSTNDNDIVSGYGIGVTCYHAMLYSIIVSLNNGFYVQASHAYGAKNYKLVGLLIQRAFVIDFTFIFMMIPVMLNLQTILIYFNIDPIIAQYVHNYIVSIFPALIFFTIFDIFKCLMQATQDFYVPMMVANCMYAIVPFFLYLLVWVIQLDVVGIALSRGIVEFGQACIIFYILKKEIRENGSESKYRQCWTEWSSEVIDFQAIKNYLRISLGIGAVIYLEWCFFEIQVLIAAEYGNKSQLAAHSSFIGIILFFFMVPMGIGYAINSYMGNLMGQGKPKVAKNLSKVVGFVIIFCAIVIWILSYFAKPLFTTYFTTDEIMEQNFSKIYTIYMICYFLPDSYQVVLGSILRSLGKQNNAAFSFIGVYYVIGLPLSLYTVYYLDMGVFDLGSKIFNAEDLEMQKIENRFTQQKLNEMNQSQKLQQQEKQSQKVQSIELDKELKLIFPTHSTKKKEDINKYQMLFQQQEEQQKKTNMKVLFRELINDSVQLPLKLLAYYNAPLSLQSTFYAELIRSGIDAINHVILLITNYIPVGPSLKYPYGIEKLKNTVVLIPAVLFMTMGGELLIDQFQALFFFSGTAIHASTNENYYSMLLYMASIGVEMTVIYKNMMDAKNLDSNNVGKQMGFIELMKNVFKKKDPVLQAILFENMITFLSTSIPLLCQALNSIYQSHLIEIIGSSMLGCIQLYLGFHLGSKNLSHVVGEKSLEQKVMDDLISIIISNEYILKVKDEKAVMMGANKFRFYATIEFNVPFLNQKIKQEYNSLIERVIFQPSYDDRREELNEIVDLEIEHNKLLTVLDENESYRSVFDSQQHIEEPLQQLELDQKFSEWVNTEAGRILKENINYKFKHDNSNYQQFQCLKSVQDIQPFEFYQQFLEEEQLSQIGINEKELKRSNQHRNNDLSISLLLEYRILHDIPRQKILTEQLQNEEKNIVYYDQKYSNDY